MTVLFAVSAFTFAAKVLMPSSTRIIIPGEDPIIVGEIFRYTHIDVAIISVATIILAASSFYLLFAKNLDTKNLPPATNHISDSSQIDVAFTLRLLDGDKPIIYSEIAQANGEILQSDLHTKTGFPKAKITRTLDYLEAKGLITRKSHGMTNQILLNKTKPTADTNHPT
jgi:DeoR/GlpR family transcriptional regulator of sugar metabolism